MSAERAAAVIRWRGSTDAVEVYRLKVCAERRAQWGDDDECDHDGMCCECEQDVAERFETASSKRRRGQAAGDRS